MKLVGTFEVTKINEHWKKPFWLMKLKEMNGE